MGKYLTKTQPRNLSFRLSCYESGNDLLKYVIRIATGLRRTMSRFGPNHTRHSNDTGFIVLKPVYCVCDPSPKDQNTRNNFILHRSYIVIR